MKTTHDRTPISDAWLRDHGIAPSALLTQPLYVLQAQRIAYDLLQHHVSWLSTEQQQHLQCFCARVAKTMGNKRIQSRVSQSACVQVMNLGTRLNRQLFKEQRQRARHINKQTMQSTTQPTTLAV